MMQRHRHGDARETRENLLTRATVAFRSTTALFHERDVARCVTDGRA
jgi:hypothetical protein